MLEKFNDNPKIEEILQNQLKKYLLNFFDFCEKIPISNRPRNCPKPDSFGSNWRNMTYHDPTSSLECSIKFKTILISILFIVILGETQIRVDPSSRDPNVGHFYLNAATAFNNKAILISLIITII